MRSFPVVPGRALLHQHRFIKGATLSPRDGGSRRPTPIFTNDPKDAVIARLLERTEWMMEDADLIRGVIERLDQTLDHVSGAMNKQSGAIESIVRQLGDQESLQKEIAFLRTELAVAQPQLKFWADVRDRIWWIGLAMMAAAAGGGVAGAKIIEAFKG